MSQKMEPENTLTCPTCLKDPALCLCALVKKLPTRLHVLILQHPQEPDKTLGSARLAQSVLANSTIKVGLSWPNLTKALGRQAESGKWGVLYLGAKPQKDPKDKKSAEYRVPRLQIKTKGDKDLVSYEPGEFTGLEGLVVLDGTWAQAKTLWWRNAWLLKLKRIVLNPPHASMYRELRREPRRECLSTLEAVAETLDALGENPEVATQLRSYFDELLKKYREYSKRASSAGKQGAAKQQA